MDTSKLEDVLERTVLALTALERRLAQGDSVTQGQIDALRSMLEQAQVSNRGEFDRLHARIDRLEDKIDGKFEQIEAKFEGLRSDVNTSVRWLVGLQVASILSSVAALWTVIGVLLRQVH